MVKPLWKALSHVNQIITEVQTHLESGEVLTDDDLLLTVNLWSKTHGAWSAMLQQCGQEAPCDAPPIPPINRKKERVQAAPAAEVLEEDEAPGPEPDLEPEPAPDDEEADEEPGPAAQQAAPPRDNLDRVIAEVRENQARMDAMRVTPQEAKEEQALLDELAELERQKLAQPPPPPPSSLLFDDDDDALDPRQQAVDEWCAKVLEAEWERQTGRKAPARDAAPAPVSIPVEPAAPPPAAAPAPPPAAAPPPPAAPTGASSSSAKYPWMNSIQVEAPAEEPVPIKVHVAGPAAAPRAAATSDDDDDDDPGPKGGGGGGASGGGGGGGPAPEPPRPAPEPPPAPRRSAAAARARRLPRFGPLLRMALPAHQLPDDGGEYVPTLLPTEPPVVPYPLDWGHEAAPKPLLFSARLVAGTSESPPQFGLMGTRVTTGQPITLNLNDCLALAFFGTPNSGKSYALGVLIENAVQDFFFVNSLQAPLCVLLYNYHPGGANYVPEMLTGVFPNQCEREVRTLLDVYRSEPHGIDDVVLLTLPEKVKELRKAYDFCQVHGIRFPLREIGLDGVMDLLGFQDETPLYGRQIKALIRRLRKALQAGESLTLELLLTALRGAEFPPAIRELVATRLELLQHWVDDGRSLRELLKPGRLIIVDIRDEWLDADLAMTLFSLLNRALVLNGERRAGSGCNLLVVIDEAHKFAGHKGVRKQMGIMVRERRHLRLNVALSSQDPPGIPEELLPLLDVVGICHHESRKWARLLSQNIKALRGVTAGRAAELEPGEMYFWAARWSALTDFMDEEEERPPSLPTGPVLLKLRSRFSHHGGATLTAVPAG